MRLDPKLYEAPYFYGRACLAQGQSFEAAPLFEKAAAIRPEDYQATDFSRQRVYRRRVESARRARHRAAQLRRSRNGSTSIPTMRAPEHWRDDLVQPRRDRTMRLNGQSVHS